MSKREALPPGIIGNEAKLSPWGDVSPKCDYVNYESLQLCDKSTTYKNGKKLSVGKKLPVQKQRLHPVLPQQIGVISQSCPFFGPFFPFGKGVCMITNCIFAAFCVAGGVSKPVSGHNL